MDERKGRESNSGIGERGEKERELEKENPLQNEESTENVMCFGNPFWRFFARLIERVGLNVSQYLSSRSISISSKTLPKVFSLSLFTFLFLWLFGLIGGVNCLCD